MSRPSGLGRGLSALLPAATPSQSGLLNVRLTALRPNPRQPRVSFDEAALDELAASIRSVGLLQPVVVRPAGPDAYEIVAGERRVLAARRAGLQEIPAVVRRTEDDQLLVEALVENVHRADLNPIEEAEAYEQLLEDFGLTHDELARRLGRSRSAVSNALRLLALEHPLRERVASGALSAGHARALLALPAGERRSRAAQRVLADRLSVRETEELVRFLLQDDASGTSLRARQPASRSRRSPYTGLQQRLSDALATRVRITGTSRRGRVVIDYAGAQDLQRLLEVLSRGTGESLANEEPLA